MKTLYRKPSFQGIRNTRTTIVYIAFVGRNQKAVDAINSVNGEFLPLRKAL